MKWIAFLALNVTFFGSLHASAGICRVQPIVGENVQAWYAIVNSDDDFRIHEPYYNNAAYAVEILESEIAIGANCMKVESLPACKIYLGPMRHPVLEIDSYPRPVTMTNRSYEPLRNLLNEWTRFKICIEMSDTARFSR